MPETLSRPPQNEAEPLKLDPNFDPDAELQALLADEEAKARIEVTTAPETDENGQGVIEQANGQPELEPDAAPLRIVLASLDKNIDQYAREAAHEKLSKKHEGPFFKRIAKSVWHNMTREYQTVKATQEARQEIIDSNNLRHHHEGEVDDKQWRETAVKRHGSDYAEHLINEEANETYHKLGADDAELDDNAKRIRGDTLDLVGQYAKGEIADDESFDMMVKRMVKQWRDEGVSQDYITEGEVLAQNLRPMGEQVGAAADSRVGLSNLTKEELIDEMLKNAEVVVGDARVGSRVEINSQLSERVAERLKGVRFLNEGRLARVGAAVSNELVVAAMLSAGAYGAKGAFARGVSAIAIPGIGAGVIAGLRERRAFKDERLLSARRKDAGLEIDSESAAQVEMEALQYETRDVGELLSELNGLYTEDGELSINDRASLEKAMALQGEIKARLAIEKTGGDKRLINFSDSGVDESGERRFDLDLSLAKLEVDMSKLFDNPVAIGMLDIKKGENFKDWLGEQKDVATGMLEGEMQQKDKLANKIMRKRMLKAAITGSAMGVAIGYAVSHAASHAGDLARGTGNALRAIADRYKGIAAPNLALMNGVSYETGDEIDLPDVISSPEDEIDLPDTIEPPAGSGLETIPLPDEINEKMGDSLKLSDTSRITFPEGYVVQPDGRTVTVTGPDGGHFTLETNKDGSLTAASEKTLSDKGLNLVDHKETVKGEPKITEHERTPREFVKLHRDSMVEMDRKMWYDNNTTAFDLNELGLQNHVKDNGDIVISIKSMTEDGSFKGASGADWREAAKNGQLFAYLSASEGTQSHAIEVQIRPDGTAVIDRNSPAGALFNKQGEYMGGFEEIGIKSEDSPEGVAKVALLATEVGRHSDTLIERVAEPTKETAHAYFVVPEFDKSANTQVVGERFTPVLPVSGRRRLGKARQPEESPPVTAAVVAEATGGEAPVAPPQVEIQQPAPQAPEAETPQPEAAEIETPTPEAGDTEPVTPETPARPVVVPDYDSEDKPVAWEGKRDIPEGFMLNMRGLSPRAHNLITKTLYDAIGRRRRELDEPEAMWRESVIRKVKQDAASYLKYLDNQPAGERAAYQEAMTRLQQILPKREA